MEDHNNHPKADSSRPQPHPPAIADSDISDGVFTPEIEPILPVKPGFTKKPAKIGRFVPSCSSENW
jgi:hypothetical protein